MLGTAVLVAQLAHPVPGVPQDLIQLRGDPRGCALLLGPALQVGEQPTAHLVRIDLHLPQERRDHAITLIHQSEQQMLGTDLRVLEFGGEFLGPLQSLPTPLGQALKLHAPPPAGMLSHFACTHLAEPTNRRSVSPGELPRSR